MSGGYNIDHAGSANPNWRCRWSTYVTQSRNRGRDYGRRLARDVSTGRFTGSTAS